MHEEHRGDLVGRRSIHLVDDSQTREVVDSHDAAKAPVDDAAGATASFDFAGELPLEDDHEPVQLLALLESSRHELLDGRRDRLEELVEELLVAPGHHRRIVHLASTPDAGRTAVEYDGRVFALEVLHGLDREVSDVRTHPQGLRRLDDELGVDGAVRSLQTELPAVGDGLSLDSEELAVGDDAPPAVLLNEAKMNHAAHVTSAPAPRANA